MESKKKRGRPKKVVSDVQERVVEVVKEVIKTVPEPELDGFELYKALKDKGFPQGGMGVTMEDPNGTEQVYIPHYHEVISFFSADPNVLEEMRDAIVRAYIKLR